MEELKVKNIIISKQKVNSEKFQEVLKIAQKKNIKIIIVKAGDRIKFEQNVYMDILWPAEEQMSENPLNNNAIVGKLVYKNFSILFTGDIEAAAEKAILREYKNNLEVLKSSILKVGHHGSRTSTTQDFLEKVNPKIGLIGVGINNKFGHPDNSTIENLKAKNIQIYRTDEEGEIRIRVNKKEEMSIEKMVK